MDYFFDTKRLPSFLVPFITLSYPVNPPLKPDSFPHSAYYEIGYRDVCVIVTLIAIMAIVRDAARVLLLEPFANWKLTRDWRRRQASKSGSSTPDMRASVNDPLNVNASGKVNGPVTTIGSAEKLVADRPPDKSRDAHRIRHAVLRFAEQGWQALYYLIQWSLGIVRVTYHFRFANAHLPHPQNSIFTSTYPRTSGQDILTCPSPVSSSCTTLCKYPSTSMLCFFSMPRPDGKTTGK
jgi:TRAM1-like protein